MGTMSESSQHTQVSEAQSQSENVLYNVEGLKKWFSSRDSGIISNILNRRTDLKAVDDIDFKIFEGEIIGVAGQSGCGKSTLAELLLGLQKPTDGKLEFKGSDISTSGKKEMKEFRKNCQMVFQDPYESLNPRFTIGRSVAEPLKIHGIGSSEERDAKVRNTLSEVGLEPPGQFIDKLPSELSGGQLQRVGLARALVLDPDFVVADEPVSMLDVSIRTNILNLFKKLNKERNITMVYISHDLSTINYLTDRTMIMYLGNIVEIGDTNDVINAPSHPYTETLVNAVPTIDSTDTIDTKGEEEVPDPVDLPEGCRYEPFCDYSTEKCREVEPELSEHGETKKIACYHPVNGDN